MNIDKYRSLSMNSYEKQLSAQDTLKGERKGVPNINVAENASQYPSTVYSIPTLFHNAAAFSWTCGSYRGKRSLIAQSPAMRNANAVGRITSLAM